MKLTVEEALKRAETKAAALRYLTDLASSSRESPDPAVFEGLGDILGEIEDLVRQSRKALDAGALASDVKR